MSYRKYITPDGVVNTEKDCLSGFITRPSCLEYDPLDFERGQRFYHTGNILPEREWAFLEDEYSPMFRAGYAAEKYACDKDSRAPI